MTLTEPLLSPKALLDHWQGHRRLTRRVIEAFPEDKLFSFAIGSMRPFSEMVKEFLKMTEPIAHGVATGEWKSFGGDLDFMRTKAELLRLWDEATARLNAIWPTIPAHRFAEVRSEEHTSEL